MLCKKRDLSVSGRRVVDIKKKSFTAYEGHFFPYLDYSATGLAFVLQLFSHFCLLFFLLLLQLRVCVCLSVRACVCAHERDEDCCCASLCRPAWVYSVNLLCSKHLSVLTSVFIAGSTWRPTLSPQAWCWWRRCQGIRWARSTRRISCDSSSHDWTASTSVTTCRFLVKELQV